MVARGWLDPFQATVMYRGQLHAEAEVRWHDEFAKVLAGLPRDEESELAGSPSEGTGDSHGDH
jgi:hypothetical protein